MGFLVCVHMAATLAFFLPIPLYNGFSDISSPETHFFGMDTASTSRAAFQEGILQIWCASAHRIAQQPVLMLLAVTPCVTRSHEILTAVMMLLLWHLHKVCVQRCLRT